MKKKYRLKRNHEIAAVVSKRQRVSGKYYTIYYVKSDSDVRIAISAGKKYGNAVERNYAKRIVREILRPYLDSFQAYSIVVVVKDISKDVSFNDKKYSLEKTIQPLLRKEKISNE